MTQKENFQVQIIENGDTFDVIGVEIFRITDKKEKSLTFDDKYVDGLIKTHDQHKADNGFIPTIFVGHNDGFRDEKEAVGFLDNIRKEGKRVVADFKNMLGSFRDDLRKFPYRSIEIIG